MNVKNKISKYWKWLSAIILIGMFSFGMYVYHWEYRKPLLEVYFFSLNRGRSIFIRTPENKSILIGGGQTSEVIREITKVTPFYKRKINYLIVPSAVPAQIGGLVEILNRYEIGEIIMPKVMATSTASLALLAKIKKSKIHVKEVERGDEIEIENNVNVEIHFPYEGFKFNKTSLPELGLSLSYASTTVYFLGNLSKTIQKDILKNTEMHTGKNIAELYNSAEQSKIFAELFEKIDPQFIFSTKEKTTHMVSDGEKWVRE